MSGSSLTEEFLQQHLNPIGWNQQRGTLGDTPKKGANVVEADGRSYRGL
jgi:hypothetical protein